ncbi:MAG: hypothetical protein ABSA40_00380 [Candidatus Dormibacteria bacterium]|jgi:hypothetical protein
MSDESGSMAFRLLAEAAHLVGEVIPPEAQRHFLNAQRELILGLTAVIEHNGQRASRTPAKRRTPARSAKTTRPRRVAVT